MTPLPRCAAGLLVLILVGATALSGPAAASQEICTDCLQVRVGPPTVVRGPFPDELDATFTAIRLPDGTMRGFSANGATYAIDGASISDMGGPRRAVLQPGEPGSISDCGRWLTSALRDGDRVIGLVHQERDCDYEKGRTGKSMAIASSTDNGLTWTAPQTIITGTDGLQPDRITGEGDCSMVDGADGYLYVYCLRNSDWKTIAVRAPLGDLTDWRKFYQGVWSEPGLGGEATAIGFFGPAAGYLRQPGWLATVTTDPWFGGVRLSFSADKVSFVDLDEPLLTIDGSDWNRPAASDLIAYATLVNPDNGSNSVEQDFVLSYIYVPPGEGFESRYLVQQDVSLTITDAPVAVQVGMALTRWADADGRIYVSSTGPLTGDRLAFQRDTTVAYMLTRPPVGVASVKIDECSSSWLGHLDQIVAEAGSCEAGDYVRERTAGWLYADEQTGTVPVYRCNAEPAQSHFVSSTADCEGLGSMEFVLGYGMAP